MKRVAWPASRYLLKRGMSATLEELADVRRIRNGRRELPGDSCDANGGLTFSDHSRNTLDLSVIPPCKALSHLPIMVDPSHGTGKRAYVPSMALASWRREQMV